MSCSHDCDKPAFIPKAIFNRPGLGHIAYRIGTYSSMREHMLDLLNRSPTLAGWTHRGADDPGIALLEANAIVGDILSFYQELYANEAFLRTARWRETVNALVQLSGYRLAPGVGGEALFALQIKGERPVTVPKGFGFKAQLQERDKQDEFESIEETIGYPHLSQFNLYRPRLPRGDVQAGPDKHRLEIAAVDDRCDMASLSALNLRAGDRIILVPSTTVFENTGGSYSTQTRAEIVVVSKVETLLDRMILTIEGALTVQPDSPVYAYVIDRTFRHFGYNAPARLHVFDGVSVAQEPTTYEREILERYPGSDYYSALGSQEMPLDQEVHDLPLGGQLIIQGFAKIHTRSESEYTIAEGFSLNEPVTLLKEIEDLRVDSLQWGNLEGPTSVVSLDSNLTWKEQIVEVGIDVRRTVLHEVISPKLTLCELAEGAEGPVTDGELRYFGRYEEVKALANRDLLLVGAENNVVQAVTVGTSAAEFEEQLADKDEINPWMWTLNLTETPVFHNQAFREVDPRVIVYGNLVKANQGKTRQEVVLGSGDQRQIFQTFAIPKAPLTYLLDESQTPAQTPELHVYVNGVRWARVDNFFNSEPDDTVYLVREDDEGISYVQFGDGKTGARLPSGNNNLVGVYRTGVGASGNMEPDTTPQATGKLKELEKVFLPGEVVGGGGPEGVDGARAAAPGRMQSLGRLVGLADYEAEALALPGIVKARADWIAPGGVPLVQIVVLTETGSLASTNKVRDTLMKYSRCRGPRRFPISVVRGRYEDIRLSLRVGHDPNRRVPDIRTAIKVALGVTGEEGNGIENDKGLFGMQARSFGQAVHRSHIIAAVQQVEGVTWIEIEGACALGQEGSFADLPIPPETAILCPATRVLSLHSSRLGLELIADAANEECT